MDRFQSDQKCRLDGDGARSIQRRNASGKPGVASGCMPLADTLIERGEDPLREHNKERLVMPERICVKARDGKKGGNILDFVALMERCTIREAALKLANWFAVSDGERASPTDKKLQPGRSAKLVAEKEGGYGEATDHSHGMLENKPLTFVLRNVDHSHPYGTARSIPPEIASHFGVGVFSGRGSMSGRVVIPIHNKAASSSHTPVDRSTGRNRNTNFHPAFERSNSTTSIAPSRSTRRGGGA
jgi:hypothetical protein